MSETGDIRQQLLELLKQLSAEQLAEVNEAMRDALISAARGEPSRFAINELVDISQQEAQRICQKIGLDWNTGQMTPPSD